MKEICVLMSTYNGKKYLRTQIDSVLNQQDVGIYLLIRDDGSTDGTQAILDEYQQKDNRVKWYQGKNIGPCQSFFDLMKQVGESEYYAFCDQDDYWEPDKLVSAINQLNTIDTNAPALYCSNLKVVDENLNFCRLAHKKAYNVTKRYLALVDFFAVGCTMVFNLAAYKLTLNHLSADCLMHDNWIFQICNLWGKVIYDFNPHIQYRQHEHNVIGARKNFTEKILDSFVRIRDNSQQPRFQNANALYKAFSKDLNYEDVREMHKIIYYKKSLINRLRLLFDYKIRGNDMNRDLRYRLLIIIGKI